MVITFIGMPGCGKSCMGRAVAGKLKMKLIDSDRLIERRYGKKLQELIDELGVEEFRRIEEETLLSIEGDNLIISTGGSAIFGKEAMEHLKNTSTVVYLRVPYEVIEKRLGSLKRRGVVFEEGQTLRDIYDVRCPLYEKYADIVIDCNNDTDIQETAIKIAEFFEG